MVAQIPGRPDILPIFKGKSRSQTLLAVVKASLLHSADEGADRAVKYAQAKKAKDQLFTWTGNPPKWEKMCCDDLIVPHTGTKVRHYISLQTVGLGSRKSALTAHLVLGSLDTYRTGGSYTPTPFATILEGSADS